MRTLLFLLIAGGIGFVIIKFINAMRHQSIRPTYKRQLREDKEQQLIEAMADFERLELRVDGKCPICQSALDYDGRECGSCGADSLLTSSEATARCEAKLNQIKALREEIKRLTEEEVELEMEQEQDSTR